MKTIWGFIKFIIVASFIMCVVGVITTISCLKKAQRTYQYDSSIIKDSESLDDLKIEDVDIKKDTSIMPTNEIIWSDINSVTPRKECIFMLFTNDSLSSYEDEVLTDSRIAPIINSKFKPVKLSERRLFDKFGIDTLPTIYLFPKSENGRKIIGKSIPSYIKKVLNDPRFDDC